MAVCRFSNTGEDWYVLVGVAKDLILSPRSVAGGFVYTYKLVNNGEKLEFLHKVRTSLIFFCFVLILLDLIFYWILPFRAKLLGQVFGLWVGDWMFCSCFETVSLCET